MENRSAKKFLFIIVKIKNYIVFFSKAAHIAQNIAEICHKYFQYFISIEILLQNFCQILQNISSTHYSLILQKYFLKQIYI